MQSILNEIINTLFGVYASLVLLRFVFQFVKADFYNPISQGIVEMTSPVIIPIRRVIPGIWGFDTASLLLAFVLYTVSVALIVLISGSNPIEHLPSIVLIAFMKLLTSIMNIFTFSLLVSIVLSFVAPMSRHPAAILTQQIAEPLMAPFRKFIPPFGGIDISPIFVFLLLSVITKLLAMFGAQFGIPIATLWLFVFIG